MTYPVGPAEPATARHPLDPDPVRSTKAVAVLVLGVVAVITGPLVGGFVPATLALLLARQARDEVTAAQGFLTGAARLRLGGQLAWIGIWLSAAALVAAIAVGLIVTVNGAGHDFPATSD